MNLNYILVYVNDFQKLRAFYIDALGMTDIGSIASDIFATLRAPDGGATIGLQDKKSTPLPPAHEQHPGSLELSFAVEDVDATHKSWKEKGVEIITEPADMPFGRYFLAKDPEGHYLSAYRFKSR
jgi:predicted enzyme related to lactoylglutathione lyase